MSQIDFRPGRRTPWIERDSATLRATISSSFRVGARRPFFVDGGVLDLLPIWAAAEMGATRVIAVNVLPVIPSRPLRAALRVAHFLGRKPVRELATYPQHFDVCIMPYQADGYTKYIYPLKLHEYLASGRPTVGTRIPALEDFSDVVLLASTLDEWSAAIARALEPAANTVERRAERRAVARRHDWQLLVREIAETIARRLGCEFVEPVDGGEAGDGDNGRRPAIGQHGALGRSW